MSSREEQHQQPSEPVPEPQQPSEPVPEPQQPSEPVQEPQQPSEPVQEPQQPSEPVPQQPSEPVPKPQQPESQQQTPPAQQTPEIWSTRLQRELTALTRQPSQIVKKNDFSRLPPFASVVSHTFDIPQAECTVTFRVEVERPTPVSPPPPATEAKVATGEIDLESQSGDGTAPPDFREEEESYVLVTLDTTIQRNSQGIREASHNSYPFQKPKAVLTKGAELFPEKCGLKDGDFLQVDFDWTPSLHLVDAVLNVGLKVRESIKRGDPFIKADMGQEGRTRIDEDSYLEDISIGGAIRDVGERWRAWWVGEG